MSDDQKKQCFQFQGDSQAQREEQGMMAEGEKSTDSNSSSSTSPTVLRKKPAGGIPDYPQSPKRALSPPNVMATIPMSASDEANGYQIEEVGEPLQLHHALNAKVADLVQFLLFKYRMQEQTNKAEIVEMIIRDDEQYYDRIFSEATNGLNLVFGIDTIEVDPVVHTYVLVIALGLTYDGMFTRVQGMPKTGLLIVALGVICMNNNCAREEAIWRALNIMGVNSMENHYIAGNVKKLFTENLVQEGYVEYQLAPDSDPPYYEFLWGPRAHAETTPRDVIEFLARINRIN
ncbi:melanoma-associated antigen 10-like [Acomys russatus]|uniref:melanoma-associated antigen 10-like n=1 Tax=Acomys russatus TaxID=60746 RepID=UPI0021E22FF6|nr:melanoma-associated antigen 10-like [Acomys russatus]